MSEPVAEKKSAKRPKFKPRPLRIEDVYEHSARSGLQGRNPLIVIHGILGSRLTVGDRGQSIWGDFRKRN